MTEGTGAGTSTLAQLVERLAGARAAADAVKAQVAVKQQAFNAEHAELIRAGAEATAHTAQLEEEVRSLAIAQFKKDGKKDVGPGVGIKERGTIAFDESMAKTICAAKGICQTTDLKAFAKIAEASPSDFPFVTFGKEPYATIATDLTKAVAEIQKAAEVPAVATAEVLQ
jgi:hypothetical protein